MTCGPGCNNAPAHNLYPFQLLSGENYLPVIFRRVRLAAIRHPAVFPSPSCTNQSLLGGVLPMSGQVPG
jgi:hypothetical protein